MIPFSGLTDQLTRNCLGNGTVFPTPLKLAVQGINTVHGFYAWGVRYGSIVSSSSNIKLYAVGFLLNKGLDSALLRWAAQVVMVTRRVIDCGRHKVKVYRVWTELGEVWRADYMSKVKVTLSVSMDNAPFMERLMGPGSYIWLESRRQAFVLCTTAIYHTVRELFIQLWHLSVSYRLVAEACSLDAANRDDAANQLLIHTKEIFEQISNNNLLIHRELMHHRETVQGVLTGLGIKMSADDLIQRVGTGLNVAARTYSTVTSVLPSERTVNDSVSTFFHTNFGMSPALFTNKPVMRTR